MLLPRILHGLWRTAQIPKLASGEGGGGRAVGTGPPRVRQLHATAPQPPSPGPVHQGDGTTMHHCS